MANPPAGVAAPNPLDVLVAKYEATDVDIKNVDQITEIDEIRRNQFKSLIKRASMEKDPAIKRERQARAFQTIRTDVSYFLGRELLTGVTVPDEEKVTMYRFKGNEYLSDRYNLRE